MTMSISVGEIFTYIIQIKLILLFSFISCALIAYVHFLWRKRKLIIKSWNMPGPLNLPFVGGAYLFMIRPEYIYNRLTRMQQDYPDIGKIWFGSKLVYFMTKPEYIEKVLGSTKLVAKSDFYQTIIQYIGEGLLAAPVPKWKKHRKIIVPTFNQKILESFVEVFAEKSLILNEILDENVGKELNILRVLSRCTLDILCDTAMGLKYDIQRENANYEYKMDKVMQLVFLKLLQIWNHIPFVWRLLGYEKKIQGYLKTLSDLIDKGTDTTASALSFVFAVLGMFTDVQDKVLEEVLSIIGPDKTPGFEHLHQLHYTERVIKETLRLFPVGAFFLRYVSQDTDFGDFVIPKSSHVYFGLVYIHRNPKYWPNPLKFDPDRFLPEEVAKRHPCTYIPFSYGPRNCIGRYYAMMNMKVIIATVIRKFRIHCQYKKIEDIKLKTNITLRFRDGAKVSVTRRDMSNN
ncbi:cytochrome P450 4C1-like isoform X3 [Sitophilus oryzae]|uniref:Cytochrome P450 4C1-like isoform X3 n=1 Tax=Sitophilus oryzae TaxID=7048 RepID=A0A6J2XQN4_SITOR|nr:cytochrome P450 4C1-like isoform X3 [Sitophilus oryzae]